MPKIDIGTLSDEELAAVIKDAQALQAQRDKAKKAKAIEDARATLAAAGLTLKDLGEGKKRGRPPGAKTKARPETK